MNIIESIKKSREKGLKDDIILEEIKRQNPQHFSLFQEIKNRKITATVVLDKIINKSSPREKQEKVVEKENVKNEVASDNEEVSFSSNNKVSKKEEDERQEFLRRIEMKEKEEGEKE